MFYSILFNMAEYYYISTILKYKLKNEYIEDLVIKYDNYTLVILKNIPGFLVFQLKSLKEDLSNTPAGFSVSLRSKGKKKNLGEFLFKDLKTDNKKLTNHLKLVVNNDNNTQKT